MPGKIADIVVVGRQLDQEVAAEIDEEARGLVLRRSVLAKGGASINREVTRVVSLEDASFGHFGPWQQY